MMCYGGGEDVETRYGEETRHRTAVGFWFLGNPQGSKI